MGVSPKWVKSKKRREKERLNDGNNNGQAMHGARKHAWRTQVCMAHASRLGQKYVLTMTSYDCECPHVWCTHTTWNKIFLSSVRRNTLIDFIHSFHDLDTILILVTVFTGYHTKPFIYFVKIKKIKIN